MLGQGRWTAVHPQRRGQGPHPRGVVAADGGPGIRQRAAQDRRCGAEAPGTFGYLRTDSKKGRCLKIPIPLDIAAIMPISEPGGRRHSVAHKTPGKIFRKGRFGAVGNLMGVGGYSIRTEAYQ